MDFEESYFEGEERDGFYVESKMKRAWAAQLKVLKAIEEVCKRHDLRYFAYCGTLLGAVRHQGFIPWDDDMDIAFLRDDYEKFLAVANELPEGYELLCIYTDSSFDQTFARVTNGKRIRYDRAHLEQWYGCPYVVGIDIFPFDYISRNKEEEELRQDLLRMVLKARRMVVENVPGIEGALQLVEEYCGVKLDRLDRTRPMEQQLRIVMDRLYQMFSPDEADEVARIGNYVIYGTLKCPKSYFERQDWMPFETTEIAVPGSSHECLVTFYGSDYMTPKRIVTHDYPFYEKQEKEYGRQWVEYMTKRMRIFDKAGEPALRFEESYFEGEERSGFFVESRMKHVWAAQLELLRVIEDICDKYGLRYFAHDSTLLGAVRHQGFIPWDDDMDIAMLRDDYEKFLALADEELPAGCELLGLHTDERHVQPFARVVNGRMLQYEKEYLNRWHGCPYQIGINIFPMDYLSRDEGRERLRENIIALAVTAKNAVEGNPPEAEEILQKLEKVCQVKLDRSKPLGQQLLTMIDNLSKMFAPYEADEVTCLFDYMSDKVGKCPKGRYDRQSWVPFETTEIAVPESSHEWLGMRYGADYMTLEDEPNHEHPLFEKQERDYEEWKNQSEALAEQIIAHIEHGEWDQVCVIIREYREGSLQSFQLEMFGVLADIYEKEQAEELEHGFFEGLKGDGSWQKIYDKYMRVRSLLERMEMDMPESEFEELVWAIKNKDISYDAIFMLAAYSAADKKKCLSKLAGYYRESGQDTYAERIECVCGLLWGQES